MRWGLGGLLAAFICACGGPAETTGGGGGGGTQGGGTQGGGSQGGTTTPTTTLSLTSSKATSVAWSGTLTISVKSNSSWSAKMKSGSWARISGTSSGSNDGTLTVAYDFNVADGERVDSVIVTAGSLKQRIAVKQQDLSSVINKKELSLTGTVAATVKLTATGDWTAAPSEDWLSVSPASGKEGSAEIKVAAKEEFIDVGSRSAKIKFTQGADSFEVPVTQGQTNVIIATESELEVPAGGGYVQVLTKSNVDYEVSCSASWLGHVETKALVEHTEVFQAGPNNAEGGQARRATITFSSGDVKETVTVTQEWTDPFLDETLPGVYGLYGRDLLYNEGIDQLSIYRHDSLIDFTILDHPGEKLIGVTGVPEGIAEGNALTVSVLQNVTRDFPLRTDHSVTLLKAADGILWMSGDGLKLIVRNSF